MKNFEKIRGSLKLLILYLLKGEELHGYALMQKLSELFINYKPSSGVIYPALQSLKRSGYIECIEYTKYNNITDEKKELLNNNGNNGKPKILYKITDKGKKYLIENSEKIKKIFEHINNVNEFYNLGGRELKEAMVMVIREIPNLSEKQKKELKNVMVKSSKKIKLILLRD
ncbi:PadR family transcriptional regulator [Methanothermococcus sp.]|uniref:PadR family transcriptional regulator n=1 Tax=Methanothermococcus sp. TaxID=2614238 RepID=UPI0025CC32C5|nr:PadR family transcriptional regulator [Methanothermococcus sp.]